MWSRLLRLLSGQVSPPRAFWALLVAFPALSLAVWIATSLRKFWLIYSWFAPSVSHLVRSGSHPSRFGPCPSGLNPVGGFPFFTCL